MARFLLFSLLVFALGTRVFAQAPPWVWSKAIYSGQNEVATKTYVDAAGNTFVVGYFNGANLTISPLPNIPNSGPAGTYDMFLAKFSPAGTPIWAVKAGGGDDDQALDITLDNTGNIYVVGKFKSNPCIFYGSVNISVSNTGNDDMFLAKYNPAGQVLWAVSPNGTNVDVANAVTTDNTDVYITGYFANNLDFGPGNNLSAVNQEDIFVARYSAAGSLIWAKSHGGSFRENGNGIIEDGNFIYATGHYGNANVTFDGTPSIVLPNIGLDDIWIAQFNKSNGRTNWVRSAGSALGNEAGMGITKSGGNLFITGYFANTSSFGALNVTSNGLSDIFIAKYDFNGNPIYVRGEGGTGDDFGLSISADNLGNIYGTGSFANSVTFGGTTTLTAPPSLKSIFVSSYTNTNVFRFVKGASGNSNNGGLGIHSNATGKVAIAGSYSVANITFSPNPSLTYFSNEDGMVAFLDNCSPLASNTISAAQTICAGQTPANLTGTLPTGGSGTYAYLWQQSPDNLAWSPASGTNNLQNYSFPGPLFANTYYRRKVSSTGCPQDTSTSTSLLITVNQVPTPSNAGPNQTICISSNNTTMAGNSPTVGTGTWTLVSGTGTITTPNSPSTTVTGLGLGVNTFQWTISNGVCPPSSSTMTITVDDTPTPSNAGPNQTICISSNSTTMAGNTPTVGTGTWTLVSGTGTITTPNSPSTTVTGLGLGVNTFQWTISNGVCPPSASTMTITVDDAPTPSSAGPDQSLCIDTPSTIFAGNNPVVGTGTWTVFSGSGNITNPNQNNSPVTNIGVGQNYFVWTITNGVCPSSSDTVYIRVYSLPTPSNAGTDQIICENNPATILSGNNPSSGNGVWTFFSGGGNITSPTQNNSTVTNLSTGINQLVWTISSGPCPASSDTMTVQVDQMPTPSLAGADQTICSSAVQLAANSPTVGNGLWTVVMGSGSVASPTNPGSSAFNLWTGIHEFAWTISNGVCPSSTDTVRINVDSIPTPASAGTDQAICINAPNTTLNGSLPTIGTGNWSLFSGSGTIASPPSPNSQVNNLGVGNNLFIWTTTNGVCPSSHDTVLIRVDPLPTPSMAGPDQTICHFGGNNSINLAGNNPAVGNGTWSFSSGIGTISNPSNPSSSVTGLFVGTNTLVWTITSGVCPASYDTVSIFVDAMPPPAYAGPFQAICENNPVVTLNADPPIVGTGVWATLSGSGQVVTTNSPNSNAINLSTGLNIFSWTVTNGVCPPSTATVTIDVNQMPTPADAGPDRVIYIPFAEMGANFPIAGNGNWQLLSGSGNLASPSHPLSQVSGLSLGSNVFRWTISSGVCPASSDDVTLTVHDFFIPNGISPNGDGINDELIIQGMEYWNNVSVKIFNRWGSLVFQDDNYRNTWNGVNMQGEPLIDDTYFYIIEIPSFGKFQGMVVIKRK